MKPLTLVVTAALPLLLCIACNNQRSGQKNAEAYKADDAYVAAPPSAAKAPANDVTLGYLKTQPTAKYTPPSVPSANTDTTRSPYDGEGYAHIEENRFMAVTHDPLSTFSIDVDAASYSNVRRFIRDGVLPPPGAVRIEELINYFDYDYPQPEGADPFSVNTEMSACPWNPAHRLLLVGLQGKIIPAEHLPAANLVFLIDVSGSMDEPDKLPLVKTSLKMLTDQLREDDKVAIVVYAGNAGLVLPSTRGADKQKIKEAIDNLDAGGSTAGGEGLVLAYKIAEENFVKGGNNRVVLSTDGDFNVGPSSDDALVALITKKRQSGIFLSVLGFGTGNYQDEKMQQLADKGNGDHYYIDNATEARKVLVREFGGTLFTIAKDVKIQIEFNPAAVAAYRLIGYEKRILAAEDFNDDQKDAGELGSGHRVTALYELIPAGMKDTMAPSVDPLKYQQKAEFMRAGTDEWLTIKLRYKQPDGDVSKLLSRSVGSSYVPVENASINLRFAAAVAEYGMLLRNSAFKEKSEWQQVTSLARNASGADPEGYRHEFVNLVETAQSLSVTHR
jgi:Ca-activated chloride channel family protein